MTSHVYALISDGVVENVIVATLAFAAELGEAVRIDHLVPTPSVGWTYQHRRFTPPEAPVDRFAGLFPPEHAVPASAAAHFTR